MRNYWKAAMLVAWLWIAPATLFAQTDICSTLPYVANPGNGYTGEIIVEQMKERAAAQALQEQQRAGWTSKMIPLKNNVPTSSLQALCIFRAKVMPQSALHVLSVRAPQEQMAAIEDAVKRLDVAQPGPKSVELTVHVLIASDHDEMLRATSASLKPVVDQLKTIFPYKQYYLLDTEIGTAVDGKTISLSGDVVGLRSNPTATSNYNFDAQIKIGNGDPSASTVRLSYVRYRLSDGPQISTEIDIPLGKQVVVGKATSGDRAYILVVSATIMN